MFTGASRYRAAPTPAAPVAPPPAPAMSGDPWTGSSRYSGAASTPSPAPTVPAPSAASVGLPVVRILDLTTMRCKTDFTLQKNTLSFKTANVLAMQSKLRQFDQALQHEIVSIFSYHCHTCLIEISSFS